MKLQPTAGDLRHWFLLVTTAGLPALWLIAAQAEEAPAIPPGPPPAVVDIFAVRDWAPAPVAPPVDTKPVPPPRPQAPQLPFRFLGKIAEPGKNVAYLLARGDRVVSVSVGETIDKTYLVEKQQGGQLYFIYKPLKIRQSISVGLQP